MSESQDTSQKSFSNNWGAKRIVLRKGGKTRELWDAPPILKPRLHRLNVILQKKILKFPQTSLIHGFLPGRSPLTNAREHVGFKYTLCMDLKDFFPSVRRSYLAPYIRENLLDICMLGDLLPQGYPTSPILSNFAFLETDLALSGLCPRYTRYADDLSFSSNDIEELRALRGLVPLILEGWGWTINGRKTSLQHCDKVARKIITGVGVGPDGIYPRRESKRKLRAMIKSRRYDSPGKIKGMKNWLGSF